MDIQAECDTAPYLSADRIPTTKNHLGYIALPTDTAARPSITAPAGPADGSVRARPGYSSVTGPTHLYLIPFVERCCPVESHADTKWWIRPGGGSGHWHRHQTCGWLSVGHFSRVHRRLIEGPLQGCLILQGSSALW